MATSIRNLATSSPPNLHDNKNTSEWSPLIQPILLYNLWNDILPGLSAFFQALLHTFAFSLSLRLETWLVLICLRHFEVACCLLVKSQLTCSCSPFVTSQGCTANSSKLGNLRFESGGTVYTSMSLHVI